MLRFTKRYDVVLLKCMGEYMHATSPLTTGFHKSARIKSPSSCSSFCTYSFSFHRFTSPSVSQPQLVVYPMCRFVVDT